MDVDDLVEWEPPVDDPEDAGDVVCVGLIEKIDAETDTATVLELYAWHRIWGGSNALRGNRAELPLAALKEISTGTMRNVAKSSLETYRKDPGKWQRSARAATRTTEG